MLIRVFGKMASLASLGISFEVVSSAVAGDVLKSERALKKCKTCKNTGKQNNKTNLQLVAAVGRAAGGGKENKIFWVIMESGFVSDERILAAYCKAPKKYFKRTQTAFASLQSIIASHISTLSNKKSHQLMAI